MIFPRATVIVGTNKYTSTLTQEVHDILMYAQRLTVQIYHGSAYVSSEYSHNHKLIGIERNAKISDNKYTSTFRYDYYGNLQIYVQATS
jgi:hypothetical protein